MLTYDDALNLNMAVLVGVLAPQLIKYVEKSREATDIQNCDSIATTLKENHLIKNKTIFKILFHIYTPSFACILY